LVLNYEKFSHSESHLAGLMVRRNIGMLVLDEIHLVKHRKGAKAESRRRQAVTALHAHAERCNPDLCVLGMSATPVINDLQEGKALLALITGRDFAEVKVKPTEANANHLHQKLMVHDLRYKPDYKQKVVLDRPEIDGTPLVPELVAAKTVPEVEQALVRAKLERILPLVRPGTLIYSHSVTNEAEAAYRELHGRGLRVGLYTGDEKRGLEPFKQGELDVLVASVTIGTGVDGLQHVCDRLIILSLPWTGAEYEQLVGRVHR
jgi:superfamily II DNA/RNA helicase